MHHPTSVLCFRPKQSEAVSLLGSARLGGEKKKKQTKGRLRRRIRTLRCCIFLSGLTCNFSTRNTCEVVVVRLRQCPYVRVISPFTVSLFPLHPPRALPFTKI